MVQVSFCMGSLKVSSLAIKVGDAMDSDPDISGWNIVYPSYLDKNLTISQGRRVRKEVAVDDPTVEEIKSVCDHLNVPCHIEELKRYPRNWMVVGRVRVKLDSARSKNVFLNQVSTLIGQLKSRQQPASAPTNGPSKAAKSKKKKKR